MGRVAIVGSTGRLTLADLAREVIDTVIAKGNHWLVICSRKAPDTNAQHNVQYAQVDYDDTSSIHNAFRGVDTVLSFIATADSDEGFEVQKKLIDAAIEMGVRRFAPSEWAAANQSQIAHYQFKDRTQKYLEEVNQSKEASVIEYCLFQPGFFTNYFAHPYATTQHFAMFGMFVDFEQRRAIIVDNSIAKFTLTTVEDLCATVADALDYGGKWPPIGGMSGSTIDVAGLIALGESIRGGPFQVDRVSLKDVQDNTFSTTWVPMIEHPGVLVAMREAVSRNVLREYLLGIERGAWSVTDEWNRCLNLPYTTAEQYLRKVWANKQ
ncbi:hypothetical protein CPAR01_16393 [Colletotrichum paranaense]|uniref:NmrA-like domain-containing protein n=1 Tax=Colletotrichum paranaense TaxID=1914294 RepID=A0ABQ9RWP2_9PEZI|nr:uncharacterized protein CPAR01_16393 [Colletotrichum paranaense]KAK1516777.1 hypothetical protein CPAR01_16393 [Colletotrichum paranaense]